MRERMVTEDAAVVGISSRAWPESLDYLGRHFTRMSAVEDAQGNLVSMVYRTSRGATLEVLK
jgi:hypothetical protein